MNTTEFHVLRCLPGTNPLRRMWAGTKLVCAAAIGVALVAKPTWSALGLTALLLVVGALVARFPVGALPRVPRWFWWLLLIGGIYDFAAGGSPEVHIGNSTIGLGGIEAWTRFTLLGGLVFAVAILLGATTPIAELPGAVDRLCTPFRWVRLPVDEFVATFTLVVRSFPLLVDEIRTLYAAWRLRQPELPRDFRILRETYDLLITAIASSLRRARDLARAMEARGGLTRTAASPMRVGLGDLVAVVLTGGVIAALFLV